MSFTDPIATAVVVIEPVVIPSKFQAAAHLAANQFNRPFLGIGQKIGATLTSGLQKTIGPTLAKIALTAALNFHSILGSKLGQNLTSTFGKTFSGIKTGLGRLNSSFTTAFNGISTGAIAAAVTIGALILIVAKLTKSFAEMADGLHRMELGLSAVVSASDTANGSATTLISNIKEIGTSLGVSTTELGKNAQQLIALGMDVQQTTDILQTFALTGARIGATSAQMERALAGLSQIVSKGTLSMEELRRQILGNLPGGLNLARVFEIIAEQTGKTTAEIKKLQDQGKLSDDLAVPAIVQAMKELNEGVDILSIRMSSLGGLFAILRENFKLIIGESFKPFIDALVPSFQAFIDQVKSGTGPISKIREDIGRFGKVVGDVLRQAIEKVLPLVPMLFNVFVDFTEAFGPLIVDIIDMAATFVKFLIPALKYSAFQLNFFLNKIPIISTVFRAIVAGILTGGVFKAIGLFGRAVGSIGGFLGRIATPATKFAETLSRLAPAVAKITIVFVALKGPIEFVIGLLDTAIEKVGSVLGAIGRLPGIKQVTGVIGSIGGAIGGAFSDDNADKVGKVFEPIPKATKDLVNMSEIFSTVNDKLKSFIDDQDKLVEAQKAVTDAQKGLADAVKGERDARNDLTNSIEAEKEAKLDLVEINQDLLELEQERAELVADVARDLRDIAAAQRKLVDIGLQLLDIDQDRADTLEKIKELSTGPTADEIAEADNKIARATLNLNDAKKKQLDLWAELNEAQEEDLDLSGLTLDQLRTTLAGIRAQTAAQRSKKATSGRSEEDILRDLEDVQIDINGLQIDLNESIQDRLDLDDIVLNNQGEITRLTRHLVKLENDKADALDDQVVSQGELNALLLGETPRQEEIKKLDGEIATLKERQREAVEKIRDAGITVKDNEEKVRDASILIRDANNTIKQAKIDQRDLTDEILGDEEAINRNLIAQIGHRGTLLGQSGQQALLNLLGNPSNADLVAQERDPNSFISQILKLPHNNPLLQALRQLMASRFHGFASGGVIEGVQGKFGKVIRVGEYGRAEMVLPLQSGPNKVWQMLSQNLPRYPSLAGGVAAIAAQQGPLSSSAVHQAVSSAKRTYNKDDGPATRGQLKELINILREQRTEVHVEAPITIESKGSDELLARKVSRQVKKELLEELRGR